MMRLIGGLLMVLLDYNTLAVRDFVPASTQLSPRDRNGDLLKAGRPALLLAM